MAKQSTVPKKPFDDAKFATMVEPLTIRVERKRGNSSMPIPLPESDDPTLPQGTGWTKELVRNIGEWLVAEWSGGGLYEFQCTDSSASPVTMSWSEFYDPREYPEKVPPPLQGATNQQAQAIPFAPLPPQPQVPRMSAFPHGLPSGNPPQQPYAQPYGQQPYPQQYPQYNPYAPPQYQMPPAPPVGTMGYAQWKEDAASRRYEDELRQLRERDMQRERETLEAKHKAELERERTAAAASATRQDNAINELRNMITQLAQSISAGQTAAKPNAELEAMQRKLDEEKREREAERRDAVMREQLRLMQENMQRQVEMIQRQMEQQATIAREAASNRPDQLVSMIQEQNRLNTEALKEIARSNSDSIKSLQNFMLSPTAMFDLASRQSQGLDNATSRMAQMYGGVVEMQANAMRTLVEMQPQGGTTAVDVVRDGVNGLKEMVERYTGMKSAESRLAVNAQIEIARAQAAAVAAQAQAAAGLSGAPSQVFTPPPPRVEQQLPAASEAQPNNVTPISAARKAVERFGRTDEEWFRALLPEVKKLRAGVARFVESLEQEPIRLDSSGQPDGVSPAQCAQMVLMAVGQVQQMGINIDAMIELLFANRVKDFVFVLLPDASDNYREDVTGTLIEAISRLNALTEDEIREFAAANGIGTDANDGSDETDEGDPDDDDANDGAVVPPPPPAKPVITNAKPKRA